MGRGAWLTQKHVAMLLLVGGARHARQALLLRLRQRDRNLRFRGFKVQGLGLQASGLRLSGFLGLGLAGVLSLMGFCHGNQESQASPSDCLQRPLPLIGSGPSSEPPKKKPGFTPKLQQQASTKNPTAAKTPNTNLKKKTKPKNPRTPRDKVL